MRVCLKCGGKMKSDNRLGWCSSCKYGACSYPGCGDKFLIKEAWWKMCPHHRGIEARRRSLVSGGPQMIEAI
jgi:hypothetical protein